MQDLVKILSVDDHPLVRDGIAFALQSQKDFQLVAEAANGQEAVDLFDKHRPDVTLMDLQMPVMSGIDAIIEIRQRHPTARFIVLSTYSGDVQASRALKAGAAAYLLKSMLRKELIETIRIVHAGSRRVPGVVARELAEHVASDALSDREVEVLRNISQGRSNKIVASQLDITEDTVKTHMRSILGKLRANDRTHAVMIGMKRGFLDA
ncbi:MAG: response regulator transcription factor [Bryobacteraceae bacterium]|jgi:DNA-binding NarL/FixJ family response regulator